MRKIKLETHKYYHVYNRGAGKQDIFKDDRDRFRFLRKIWELNNKTKTDYRDYLLRKMQDEGQVGIDIQENFKDKPGFGYPKPGLSLKFSFHEYYNELAKLPKLVEIVCYNLLDNHYHFILKQLIDQGIEMFMHKLATSYVKYFNHRHTSSGTLFQGPYKAYPINNENKLAWLSSYVNCNYEIHKLGPAQEWQFSSFRNYLGSREGKLANTQVVIKLFNNNIESYRKYCHNVIKEAQDEKKARKYLLD